MKYTLLSLSTFMCVLLSCHSEKDPTPQRPEINQRIEKLMADHQIPGLAAGILVDNQIKWSGYFGFRDLENKLKLDPETIFKVGSLAKPVIALSVMKLVEENKLDLDSDVNSYLPFHVINPKLKGAKITLRHLMSHTSGINDDVYSARLISDFVAVNTDHRLPLSEFCKGLLSMDGQYYHEDTFRSHTPGTAYEYSNVGASLAALIVESVSGQSFDTYSKNAIFKPLGSSYLDWHLRDLKSHLALNYDENLKPYGLFSIADYPSGGLHANLTDVTKLMTLFIQKGTVNGKRILNPESIQEIERSQFPGAVESNGEGLFLSRAMLEKQIFYGHNGSILGSHALFWFDPDQKIGVVILLNKEISFQTFQSVNTLLEMLIYEAKNLK